MALLEDHALEKAKAILKLKAAARHIDEAMDGQFSRTEVNYPSYDQRRASKRRGALQKLWMPTQREIGIYIAHCVVQRLTGTRRKHPRCRDVLRLTICRLRQVLRDGKELLLKEIKAAHGFPFLNLHHDGWSTGNGKVSVLGTSASFIDETWSIGRSRCS
ncbi:hypothetical protein GQ600_15358 [Phytophthora cactorum]|nr:hypothetical protein GQ600_15358 [Phytophthora cactorum]